MANKANRMRKAGASGARKAVRTSVRSALLQAESDLRGKNSGLRQAEIARRARINSTTYSSLKNPRAPHEPSLSQAIALAQVFREPLASMVDPKTPGLDHVRDGIACRLTQPAAGGREQALRLAALGLLMGEAPGEIESRIEALWHAREMDGRRLDERRLREMATGGLSCGLVEILLSESGDEAEDPALAARLAEALKAVAPSDIAPRVRVVRNCAHPEFSHDPSAPFLVALVAHRVVSAFMHDQEGMCRIGLAGGAHCETFVRTTGSTSSPFPKRYGDKQITLVPLTLEPFRDHGLPLSDAVVGQMASTARHLLGPERVAAPTFQSFGYLVRGRIERLDGDAITMVREHYPKLHVAIYGCGDPEPDGWLSQILHGIGVDDGLAPATDVCLNLLSEDARPIPLEGERQFVGASLTHIRRLARSKEKLALLLTSGRAKGLPLTIAVRAGCAGAVVCDQAAARAALEALGVDADP